MQYDVLGQRIKARRKELKLTQGDLAKMVEISTSFIGHIERGGRVLSVDTLRKLCIVLDLSADDLLGLERDHRAPKLSEDEKSRARQLLNHALELLADE